MIGTGTPLEGAAGRKSLLRNSRLADDNHQTRNSDSPAHRFDGTLASGLSPYFANIAFILDSSTYYIEFCLVALVLTLVIIAGEIDLSIASTMALSARIFAVAVQAGVSIPVAMAASLGSGARDGCDQWDPGDDFSAAFDCRHDWDAHSVSRSRPGAGGRSVPSDLSRDGLWVSIFAASAESRCPSCFSSLPRSYSASG